MEVRFGGRVGRQMTRMILGLCVALIVCSVGCANLCPRAEKQCTAVGVRAEISPLLAWAALGSEVQFTVKIAGKRVKPVEWLVNGIPGGNETLGTIARGVYHSPAVAPIPNEMHIQAKLAKGGRSVFSTVIVGRADPALKLVGRWTTDNRTELNETLSNVENPPLQTDNRTEGQLNETLSNVENPLLLTDNRTEGQLKEFHGICLDQAGNIIVTDPPGDCVYRYTRDGKFLDEIGHGKGTGPGFFDGPRDAKVDPKGRVYVVDGSSNTLQRFDPDGKIVVSKSVAEGGKTDLNRPHSIAIAPSGRIYVADTDNGRVAVFDEDCNFLMDWPTPLVGPEKKIAPTGVGVDPNGDVFVVDYNGVCYKYTGTGELLFSFAESGGAYHAMCMDKWGDVYFAAGGRRRGGVYVDKFNNNGVHVLSIEIQGEGRFYRSCVAVDTAGNVYAAGDKGVEILAPTSTEAVAGEIVPPAQ